MREKIEWPKEWDPDKKWLNSQSDHLLTEPRTTGHWHKCLLRQGISMAERAHHLLGGPEVPVPRTLEDCKREIQTYFDANEKRPSVTTSAEWSNWNNWLRRQGTSLSRLCDEMGLPALLHLERTLEDCKREIRAYFEANGVRPMERASKEGARMGAYLRRQGSSFRKLCDEMGLPAFVNLERTMEDCKREIRAYYEANGKRPTENTSKEWGRTDDWLRHRGSSVSQICDEMGLPALLNLERTKADCEREVQAYFDANGKRPPREASAEWARMDHWFRSRGSSLSRLCDEMGLPPFYNRERTMEDCKREVRAYFKANGVRPNQRTSAEWGNWNSWLKRQGSTLRQLVAELGLPQGGVAP